MTSNWVFPLLLPQCMCVCVCVCHCWVSIWNITSSDFIPCRQTETLWFCWSHLSVILYFFSHWPQNLYQPNWVLKGHCRKFRASCCKISTAGTFFLCLFLGVSKQALTSLPWRLAVMALSVPLGFLISGHLVLMQLSRGICYRHLAFSQLLLQLSKHNAKISIKRKGGVGRAGETL